jgi:hypothetical protein
MELEPARPQRRTESLQRGGRSTVGASRGSRGGANESTVLSGSVSGRHPRPERSPACGECRDPGVLAHADTASGDVDVDGCIEVLRGLPDYFTPDTHQQVAVGIRADDAWCRGHGRIVGKPVLLQQRYRLSAEITSKAIEQARSLGLRAIEVKTLDESSDYEPYIATRAFWERMGFVQIDCIDPLPGWPPGNPSAIRDLRLAAHLTHCSVSSIVPYCARRNRVRHATEVPVMARPSTRPETSSTTGALCDVRLASRSASCGAARSRGAPEAVSTRTCPPGQRAGRTPRCCRRHV